MRTGVSAGRENGLRTAFLQKASLSGAISEKSISESGRSASRASLRLRAAIIRLSFNVLRMSLLTALAKKR